MIEKYWIDTDDNRLAVSDNRGDGPAIMLVHGSGFSKDVFREQFRDPALSEFRLIALDLPGHGDSADGLEAGYNFPGFARAITAVIENLGLTRSIVAGWSLGGHAAIELLDQGAPVAGIATFGTPPLPQGALGMIRGFHFNFDALLASKARFTQQDAMRFERATLGRCADGAFVERILRVDEKLRPAVARSMLYGPGCDQRQAVLSSAVPVCLIQGRNDPLVRTGYVASLQAPALYGGGCQVIADAAHAPFLEQPATFNALLADFTRDAVAGDAIAAPEAEAMPFRMAG